MMWAPSPRSMNSGAPPTERNARTGLLTPPGRSCCARSNNAAERSVFVTIDSPKIAARRANGVRGVPEKYQPLGLQPALGQPAGRFFGVVGDNHPGAGPLDRQQA